MCVGGVGSGGATQIRKERAGRLEGEAVTLKESERRSIK